MTTAEQNEYELQRQQRIKENHERMKALNLPALASAVAPKPKPASSNKRSTVGAKRRLSEQLPRRTSSRLRGEKADGVQIFSEKRNGEVLVLSGSGISYPDKPAPEPRDAYPKTDLPFRSNYQHESTDASFLTTLKSAPSHTPKNTKINKSTNLDKIKSFTLQDDDVAKVTTKSITHLSFCPRSDILIVAAADKQCTLGLWNVDHSTNNDGNDECDGTYMFPSIHRQYISGLKWGNASSLFTASYDGSLRHFDAHSEKYVLAWGDEEKDYSAMEISNDDCNTAYIGDKYGDLDIIDLRSKQRTATVELHNKKINTVHIDGHLLVTGSTDTRVCLFDIRKLGGKTSKPVATADHNNSCQSAYFAPDGSQRVLTTSLDNTVRVWDAKKSMAECIRIKHDNNTGQWLSPFRAVWTACSSGAVIGNMHRYVDVIDVESGKMAVQLSGEGMTAIPTRNCVHGSLGIVCASTGSGRCHVYK